MQVSIAHVFPQDGSADIEFAPAYPVVMTTFQGGWWDAAQLYLLLTSPSNS